MWWILCAAAAIAAEPDAEAMSAVVLVHQGSAMCAGALIDDRGTVATAYHCVAAGGRPRVTTRSGGRSIGRVIAVDRGHDLALIAAPELAGAPHLSIRADAPDLGETVSALGHPYGSAEPVGLMEGGLRWSMTQGVVSAIGPRALQFSAPINPGNSGGPVVDADGEVVAVVSRRVGGGEGLGFGARAERLSQLVEREEQAMGPLGGTVSVMPVVTTWLGEAGTASAGGRVDFAFRDVVVLGMIGRFGLSQRWVAAESGQATYLGNEGRVALRARLGRGRYAARIDGYGAIAALPGVQATIERRDLDLRPSFDWSPLVGGQITMGGGGLDLGWSPTGKGLSASVMLMWPGTLGVF